jgi:hypothetical protein
MSDEAVAAAEALVAVGRYQHLQQQRQQGASSPSAGESGEDGEDGDGQPKRKKQRTGSKKDGEGVVTSEAWATYGSTSRTGSPSHAQGGYNLPSYSAVAAGAGAGLPPTSSSPVPSHLSLSGNETLLNTLTTLVSTIPSVATLEAHYMKLEEVRREQEKMLRDTERLMGDVRRGLEELGRVPHGHHGHHGQQTTSTDSNASGTAAPSVPLQRTGNGEKSGSVWGVER